jgi:hypothetical protein
LAGGRSARLDPLSNPHSGAALAEQTQYSTSALQEIGVSVYHVMADTNIRAQNPGQDYAKITSEKEMIALATLGGREVSTDSLDMSKIAAGGAKMIIRHGTADEANSYLDNLKDYEAVLAKTPSATSWLRMFFVPGVQHCRGGNSPTEIEGPMVDALVIWVETGKAPESVLAPRVTSTKGVDRLLRLGPEPSRASLKAPALDPNSADNWECRTPGTGGPDGSAADGSRAYGKKDTDRS